MEAKMALEMIIYNLQNGGRKVCFRPGQSGRVPDEATRPPFYVRDQQKKLGQQWLKLQAQSLQDAKVEALTVQERLQAVAAGVKVNGVETVEEAGSLKTKVAEYLEEMEHNKRKTTWRSYENSLGQFLLSCPKRYLKDVDRKDLMAFKTFLANQKLRGRKPGSRTFNQNLSSRSVYNNFLNVMVFLSKSAHKMDPPIKKDDWPEKTERDADAYSVDEIKALLENTDAEGRLLLNCFLNSGMRVAEIGNLTYGDIDHRFSIWEVRNKANWKTKTKASARKVPVAVWLTKKILERQTASKAPDAAYIFPNQNGASRTTQLIRVVQRAARAAGLKGRFDNHKFRASFATECLRNGSTVPDVMAWVGHTKPETILRYAKRVNLENADVHKKATQWSDKFAGIGD
jgi:integrase